MPFNYFLILGGPPDYSLSAKKIDSKGISSIMAKNFLKEVNLHASARTHFSQEVLRPGCSGGLGKAHTPKPLDEAGEVRLGSGPH